MSADIVVRLRSHGYPFAQSMRGPSEMEHRDALMDEAADEIEKLTAIVDRFSWLALDAMAEETLRLARIGAWLEAASAFDLHEPGEFVPEVTDFIARALAAGAPVEPPQEDAL